ncbi:testis-expressed protein 2 isoform X1 [Astyanax mexicanus]|uniref:testis-expressed protein 2 isoform X1 n=1 Tax=Astyanax mexicanus TaxID=7994 RepID=UPI0020CABE13|nr:testis-expressed protein 2 isoform X1 [Astyanax mexicanus]
MAGIERCPERSSSCETKCPSLQPGHLEQQETARRGIVIQLTGTEGEWDSLDDNELIFTLDKDGKKSLSSTSSLPKPRPCSMDIRTDDEWSIPSSIFHMPLSPSSPGSLGDCSSSSGLGFLSPTHRPLASLVKSLSTELELKDNSSLKPKPFLSLVKSISTELSRSEPEVSQSKSDSRLNLHLWTQLTQSKNHNGDSRTAPPSPVELSPSEPKAGFFKTELEDTRRKLTEAMHEPLSVFSKIMREDSVGSPKHHRSTGSMDSLCSKGFGRSSGDHTTTCEGSMRTAKRADCDGLPMCSWAVRRRKRGLQRSYLTYSHHSKPEDAEAMPVVFTDENVTQDGHTTNKSRLGTDHALELTSSPVPKMALCCVAALSYCYLILPWSPYWSGMLFGLAFGVMLGLFLIRLGSARPRFAGHPYRLNEDPYHLIQNETFLSNTRMLKGWMNEMYTYDPETYHPSIMHSVFVTLDGPCLRLDYPRNNIPRWATFDEPPHEKSFIYTRTFQLDGSKVFLLPPVLACKRVWNRKYPICITLARGEERTEEAARETHHATHRAEKLTHPPSKASHPTTLYLFGRTGREKEEWFYHLLSASSVTEEGQCESTSDVSVTHEDGSGCPVQVTGVSSRDSTDNVSSVPVLPADLVGRVRENVLLDYTSYMTYLLSSTHATHSSPPNSHHSSTQASPTDKEQNVCYHVEETQPMWINALIGRIFWDFLREKYWADQVAHKIQRKLSKIRLPYFMDELTLTELTMGSCMPQITGTSLPHVNTRGLWLQLEIDYTGALQMTLETKINLSKLGKDGDPVMIREVETSILRSTRSKLSVLADSDAESSSAGSSDEEEAPFTEPQGTLGEKGTPPGAESGTAGGSTGRRILRFVDKIAKSKYFQKATENEYIKKKIEEMSNTPLLLTVEVQELSGLLAVNIPPPPTDRIWYSFCVPPKLDLRVRPKLGEREVTFCHVTEWIEKKLQDEFQKVFVLPNMDDIYLPLMHSSVENPAAPQQNPATCSPTADITETSPLKHTSSLD